MSRQTLTAETLKDILSRAVIDPVFRDQLFQQPDQALAEYMLTDQELAGLKKLNLVDLYNQVGRLVVCQLLPIRVGKRLVIAPDWVNQATASDDRLIKLYQQKTSAGIDQAGLPVGWDGAPVTASAPLSFGSGIHSTTRMCLEALEELVTGSETVVDLGTGSGILAIAAAKLGAARVLALDTDPSAVKIAWEHVLLNQVEKVVRVELGSIEYLRFMSKSGGDIKADLAVANLVAQVIPSVLQDGLADVLQPEGWLIISGFRSGELAEIEKSIETAGLEILSQKQVAGWCALISRRHTIRT